MLWKQHQYYQACCLWHRCTARIRKKDFCTYPAGMREECDSFSLFRGSKQRNYFSVHSDWSHLGMVAKLTLCLAKWEILPPVKRVSLVHSMLDLFLLWAYLAIGQRLSSIQLGRSRSLWDIDLLQYEKIGTRLACGSSSPLSAMTKSGKGACTDSQ